MVEVKDAAVEPMVRALWVKPDGAAVPLEWRDAVAAFAKRGAPAQEGWLWIHLDRADDNACAWLNEGAGLSAELAEALTLDDTRPRAARLDDGALLILRGKNRDSRSPREPMASLRMFVTRRAVISVRLRPFSPTAALANTIDAGRAPASPGAFVGRLVEIAMAEIEATLDGLDARLEALEMLAFAAPTGHLRSRRNELNRVRRQVLAMKRFMRPQAEALREFAGYGDDIAPPDEAPGLREAAHQAARIGDDLEALRESAALVNEEMQARIADRLNKTMVTLAAVSTVFLPLTFTTGLLGVNLAGIPFAQSVWAFAGFVCLLSLIAAGAALAVRRLNRP
ncbi:MAG: hypothetical protein MRY74_02450 [Neomegalonema sp.]|nr:hypothetical protein [Neomegalonema sp.]